MRNPLGNTSRERQRRGGKRTGERGSRGSRHSRQIDEEQVLRAGQLERIGRHRYAERVRKCGAPDGVLEFRRCGLRWCSRCAVETSLSNAAKVCAAIIEMSDPVAGVLTLLSRTQSDLSPTFDRLVRAMHALRRNARTLGIRRFVGAIHPKMTERGDRWNLHVHVAFDADGDAIHGIGEFWRRATRGRGSFEVERDRLHVETVNG